MLDKYNIISTSVSEAVEKIPTDFFFYNIINHKHILTNITITKDIHIVTWEAIKIMLEQNLLKQITKIKILKEERKVKKEDNKVIMENNNIKKNLSCSILTILH